MATMSTLTSAFISKNILLGINLQHYQIWCFYIKVHNRFGMLRHVITTESTQFVALPLLWLFTHVLRPPVGIQWVIGGQSHPYTAVVENVEKGVNRALYPYSWSILLAKRTLRGLATSWIVKCEASIDPGQVTRCCSWSKVINDRLTHIGCYHAELKYWFTDSYNRNWGNQQTGLINPQTENERFVTRFKIAMKFMYTLLTNMQNVQFPIICIVLKVLWE